MFKKLNFHLISNDLGAGHEQLMISNFNLVKFCFFEILCYDP